MLIPIWQRLLGILIYMLPWSDTEAFAQSLNQAPEIIRLVFSLLYLPAFPILLLQRTLPYGVGSLILFLGLFLAVVRNPKVPYFLRFNTLQALLLSIILAVLEFGFFGILKLSPEDYLIFSTLSTTVMVAMLAIVIFALIECLRGREPDLPGISQAVRMQLY
ncbi:MAG: Tic20 family protein [Prochlorococcus sp.]